MDPHSVFADPDPAFLLNVDRIRIPQLLKCGSGTGSSLIKFLQNYLEKDKKDCSKVKHHGAGPNLLLIFKNKITITSNFHAFLLFFLKIFPPGSGARREVESGSMRIRIHSPATRQNLYIKNFL